MERETSSVQCVEGEGWIESHIAACATDGEMLNGDWSGIVLFLLSELWMVGSASKAHVAFPLSGSARLSHIIGFGGFCSTCTT